MNDRLNSAVARAIAAILSGSASGLGYAASVADTASQGSESIQEITVTAQRRTENLQDVPIAIQAFTATTLTQLNVQTFDDLLKYLPNVTAPSNGPAQGYIYMRGLSSGGSAGTQSSGSTGGFPNVAIYLDDQSGQLPGRNLDIYAADLERIEVLKGPQGTLFGAGAQAGVIRYITNKPKLDVTEGNVEASYGTTAGGADNSSLSAVINLPMIQGRLALRAVIYDDNRGGYINNVPSTFTRKASDLGINFANYAAACSVGVPSAAGLCTGGTPTAYTVPPGSPVINNQNLVGKAINPVSYQGIRASALYEIGDDWNVLIEQAYQNTDAQGVFYQMPRGSDGQPLRPRQVTLFNPSYDKDRFENTAWTLNGRFGALKAVYAGSYLVRNVDQVGDYTNYARGVYADYYQCHGADPNKGLAAACYSPSSTWHELEHNTHQSHEIRFSTPDDGRARAILGAFFEDFEIQDQTQWFFKSLPPCTTTVTAGCLTNVAAVPGASTGGAPPPNDNTAFFEDIQRGYKQYAIFGSGDYDLIPNVLTLTAGTRYYHFSNKETGMSVSGFGCYEAGPAPCTTETATNMNAENLRSTYSGFKSRANLSWHVAPDVLVYYTWSQGFRPGGFNQASSCHALGTAYNNFCTPLRYTSDSLTNNEIGWKGQFFDHRLQWNGAIYQENWNNVQVDFFDPGQLGNLLFFTNGPDYRIRGVETYLVARATDGLTAFAGASWNSSSQTNSPFLIANDPALLQKSATASEFGKPIMAFRNPYGPLGSPTANSPPLQFNIRVRYETSFADYRAFLQVGGTHTGHSFTQSGSNPTLSVGGAVNTTFLRFEDPAYSQFDASAGLAKDAWTVQVFATNLTDRIASVFTSTGQFVESQTVNRPRVIGVKFGYRF
ncbi:MAG: TonB-dependent receptor [Pseudomonadota bacterium]|nr:TonB-dependent receptor [Pseudomonadota bacterium]